MSKWLVIQLFSLTLGLTLQSAFAQNNCPQGHCSAIDQEMNAFCISNGMAGKPYLVFGPDGKKCFCPCSCVAPDTVVSTPEQPFATIFSLLQNNALVQSPLANNQSSYVDKLLGSDTSLLAQGVTVHRLRFSNGSVITVSPEHTFVSPNNRVTTAEQLALGDTVLDGNLNSVLVTENLQDKNYRGFLMNVVLNENSFLTKDHFLVTNAILSGDWLIQTNYSCFKAEINARLGKIATYTLAQGKQ